MNMSQHNTMDCIKADYYCTYYILTDGLM